MNNEQILVKFLNCGFLDLKVLEDTKFDVMEIISEIERPTLNDIICAIFQKGIDLLLNALMEKQRDFDCPDEIKYLSGEDIDFDINFVASRIYFLNNSDIWNLLWVIFCKFQIVLMDNFFPLFIFIKK